MPIGILFARYFKYLLAARVVCKVPFWFVLHRPLLIVATLITLIGFVIVLESASWTWVPSNNELLRLDFSHSVFGILVIILAVIQVITETVKNFFFLMHFFLH